MPERGTGKAKIKLNMAGEVSMSSVIVRSISEANENMLADFRHSEDYKLIMEWDSEEKVWVGELQEVAEAPVI